MFCSGLVSLGDGGGERERREEERRRIRRNQTNSGQPENPTRDQRHH